MTESVFFQPVIIGTDLNTYGVARAFHMAYGSISKVFGTRKLLMVDHSKICDVTEVPNFSNDDIMVKTLKDYAVENSNKKLILFAASEQFVFRILSNYNELSKYYVIPYTEAEQGIFLSNKMNFYELCEKYELDYPKAEMIDHRNYSEHKSELSFPVVLKPAESSDYFDLKFEGKEKAYILEDADSLNKALSSIYGAGYKHNMILQEYVYGDVTNEYVMNVYSDSQGKVRLMSLGRIAIEDPDPVMRGNYVAIISPEMNEDVQMLYHKIKHFLESINYTGLSNFDFKLDASDGKFKVFEINMRQGRSSFFSTLAGANIAVPIVEDLVMRKPVESIIYGDKNFLWMNCFSGTVYKMLERTDLELFHQAKKIANKGTTLFYDKDLSIQRRWVIFRYFSLYKKSLLKNLERKQK